jgi:DNA-binding NarL/FixJ family response regulator
MEAVQAQSALRAVAVIAADEILQRRAIAALRRDGFAVSSAAEAAALVVVSDGGWRALLEQSAALRERHHDAALIVVAGEFPLRELPRLLEAGIGGVVLESDLESTIGAAVRAALSGQFVFPSAAPSASREAILSTREKQVLAMVVLGCTNAEIATTLHVAETTVKSHLTSTFRKLGVRSRSEASARVLDPQSGLGLGVVSIAEEDSALHLTIDGDELS